MPSLGPSPGDTAFLSSPIDGIEEKKRKLARNSDRLHRFLAENLGEGEGKSEAAGRVLGEGEGKSEAAGRVLGEGEGKSEAAGRVPGAAAGGAGFSSSARTQHDGAFGRVAGQGRGSVLPGWFPRSAGGGARVAVVVTVV